ncbi:unnamed protein product [Withania somnifera]
MATFAVSGLNSISSISSFNNFTSKYSSSLLGRRRTLLFNLRRRRRRGGFFVSNVASDQKQKTKDSSSDEGFTMEVFQPDSTSVLSSIKYHAEFTPSFSPEKFELPKAYYATAESVRDMLIISWNATYDFFEKMNVKQAYYLSMEFLQGRALLNAIGNLGLTGPYADALTNLGYSLEDVARQEPDAALGNGGLGRLASCFLDSMATLNYPAWGYGLRYRYGLFKQLITKDGQEEVAENWLEMGNPWEIVRNDISYPVKFYGTVTEGADGKKEWVGGEDITAVAYDVPIPGYKTKTTINLRLWSTKLAAETFDLRAFNAGDHAKAYEAQKKAEKICYILYPGDESLEGKTLRLKQQYTLCSASLQDIIARFERRSGNAVNWDQFPEKVAVQMNDTHPTLCIPELLRILMDVKGLSWKQAWEITQRTVAYTNHTVLPEALEKWSFTLLGELLPRHVEIIAMIDEELLHTILAEYGTKDLDLLQEKLNQMRILDNVELPSSVLELLIKSEEDIVDVDKAEEQKEEEQEHEEEGKGEETERVKAETTNKEEETKIEKVKVEDPQAKIKQIFGPHQNRQQVVRMANLCVVSGHAVNGVAEIHSEIVKKEVFNEFYELWPEKFQNKTNGVTPRRWLSFCNPELSEIITKWTGSDDWLVNTEILAELRKFADNEELQSEWRKAKRNNKMKIVSLIKETTGYVVSPDAMFDVQVVFVPDYNVSVAEVLIPGSELSQHISTAGMEASGTSNMKFSMNGCVLIGTLDGANVEIREEVGEDNFFLFGAQAHEIAGLRKERAEGKFVPDTRFEEVKAFIRTGVFGPYNYEELIGSLEGNEGYGRADYFLVGKDFPDYIECQDKVDEAYRDQKKWTKMSILNTAGSSKFSSDRTIHQYARDIWRIEPVELPSKLVS